MEIKKNEYSTMRIRRDILYKITELRGRLKVDSPDEVVEYLIGLFESKKLARNKES